MRSELSRRDGDLLATDSERLATRLHDLVLEARIAMMTTVRPDGQLESRPMVTLDEDYDGHYWFATVNGEHKISHIEADPRVSLTYAHGSYVSVSGTAEIVRDRERIREIWNDLATEWFGTDAEDPNVVLIMVTGKVGSLWEDQSVLDRLRDLVRTKIVHDAPSRPKEQTVTREDLQE